MGTAIFLSRFAICLIIGATFNVHFARSQIISGGRPLILNNSQNNIFDPSIAGTTLGTRSWLTYSSVNPSPRWLTNPRTVTTRAAYSDNDGATWTDSGQTINNITDVAVPGQGGGTWVNEVSSILFDATATSNSQFKLFWHHYLMVNGSGEFQNGWISYKSAATPTLLGTAPEVKFLAGAGYDTGNNTATGLTQPPVAGVPLIQANLLSPALASCLVFTEPGAMISTSGIYLAITCVEPYQSGLGNRPILLKCAAPCNPVSSQWSYVGTLLSEQSARAFGFPSGVTAADLFSQNGKNYLIVTPVTPEGYNGCLIFVITNIDKSQISATPTGSVQGAPGSFNGACTYEPATANSGVMYDQAGFNGSIPTFSIYATGQTLN